MGKHLVLVGGGDCIYFKDRPLDKVGVYAVRENPVLYYNLMASLEETDLIPLYPLIRAEIICLFSIWETGPE